MNYFYNKITDKNNNLSIIFNIILIVIILYILIISYNIKYIQIQYKTYIKDCNNLKIYKKNTQINQKNPYFSIGIPVYNMEKYIEKSILSLINQSFQNIEIVIVNDNSNDNTKNILKRLQKEYENIKIINHYKNLGVYCSRIDSALNSNGIYFLFIDPDDMLLNPYLFEELYKYNLKYNLDLIEFIVYHKEEGKKKIYFPFFHNFNHYHQFKKKIIYQPELSNILFFKPNTKKYSSLICRTIWNKIIRKSILFKSIKYIENFFHNFFLITADDTFINIMFFNFANNYTNIKKPGYLYNIRNNSMSRIGIGYKHDIMVSYNYLLYYEFLYNYIKEFKKDLNFLFYDLKISYNFFLKFKELNSTKYKLKTIKFLNEVLKDDISSEFKYFINEL